MGLESANYINDFKLEWPLPIDSFNKTDDHILMIKKVLKNTFPGFTTPCSLDAIDFSNIYNLYSINIATNAADNSVSYKYAIKIKSLNKTDKNYVNNYIHTDSSGAFANNNGLGALGSIFYSVLTEAQMNILYPTNFVLCDGRSVIGTEYHRLFSIEFAPNMTDNSSGMISEATTGTTSPVIIPHRPFTTDLTAITWSTNTNSHNHGGHNHKHRFYNAGWYYSLYINTVKKWVDTWYPENWTDPYGGSLNLRNTISNGSPYWIDDHNHYADITFLGKDTSPPTIFLNAFLRVN